MGERLEEVQSKDILEESDREVRDDRVWKRKRTGIYWVRLKRNARSTCMAGKNESKVDSLRSLSEFFTDAGERLEEAKGKP